MKASGRKSLRRAALWLLVAGLAAGCAYGMERGAHLDRSQAEQVEANLARIRGLDFEHPVPLVIDDSAQAQKEMAAEMARSISARDFQIDGQTGIWLGLYPPGLNLQSATMELLHEQVAAFYDPESGRMIVVSGIADTGLWHSTALFHRRNVVAELLLAHELTHALQDQHFGLKAALNAIKDNDDRALALKSVAEGDATIAGFGYVAGGMDHLNVAALSARLSNLAGVFARQSHSVPMGLRAPMAFEYSAGVRFVSIAYQSGGWTAVNALYAHPPQSSQQILHPALYFDRPTPPLTVKVHGYEDLMAGWQVAEENTMGEFMLSVLLKRLFGPESNTDELARAWAGDRIVTLSRGGDLSVLWLIVFRGPAAAAKFTTLYTGDLSKRLPAVASRVGRRDSMVLVAIGPATSHFAKLAPQIFSRSRISSLPPAAPPLPPATIRTQLEMPVGTSIPRALLTSSRSSR